MAESVDALVSNTSGATHPGSTPGLGTQDTSKSIRFWGVFYLLPVNKVFGKFSYPQHIYKHLAF